ncbi:MAG TPA: hypothetical protein VKI65_00635, partial [Gemmataceae bacterium]|nr:hypothetical protein [Gemmataceae bacterium]
VFGMARCDVTPPVGIYHRMWGAATHERASGVHRPLTATALVFRALGEPAPSETEQVVVANDHCLLWAREMDALREAVCRQTGLAPEQFVAAFSHSHSAALMGLEREHLPGGELIRPYLKTLGEQITQIVREARANVRPTTISYALGRCPMAGNRDFWDADSHQWVCGFNPQGPSDDTVLVAQVSDSAQQRLATVMNYACHPTTLAWQNTLISPDFVGAMRETVETVTGLPCIFLQGASGDLGPRDGYVGDPAVADRNGRQLGYAALSALEALPPPQTQFEYAGPVVSGATLGTWEHVPLSPEEQEAKSHWRLRRWKLDLDYRPGIPTREGAEAERARWQAEEQAALKAGDNGKARDAHAMVERMERWLMRISVLPPGSTFPLPITLWQMGDAFWLAVEGEHYQLLQSSLRARFPGVPIVVMTLANGSRVAYLPRADTYGKGLYQESIAILAPGSLERVIDVVGEQIAAWSG